MKIFAVIPAGGIGTRSGSKIPKQFLKFNGKELLVYTLEIFQKNKFVDEIAVSVNPAYLNHLKKLKKKYKISKLKYFAESGKERQDSVYNALKEIPAEKDDLILVHDAARPLLPNNILNDSINKAKEKGNAVVCVKASDTLIKGDSVIHNYLDRKEIYYVQTPQLFFYKDIMKAMLFAYKNNFTGTDESMLVKKMGKKIHISEGSSLNIKITNADDLILFKKLIRKIVKK